MGDQGSFPPAKLLIGVILGPATALQEVLEGVGAVLAPPEVVGRELPFDYTDYYHPEMGVPLRRVFLTFEGLWDPARLAEAKIATNRLEQAGTGTAAAPGRRFNLDPGLLSLHSLVLASTKPHAHRIPLHSGIYGEVTLVFRNGAYRPLPWTYPDYASAAYQEILLEIRNKLKTELKQQRIQKSL
ncbi:MAG: DUF4416 family protein [Spirochaetaceae bacterium]